MTLDERIKAVKQKIAQIILDGGGTYLLEESLALIEELQSENEQLTLEYGAFKDFARRYASEVKGLDKLRYDLGTTLNKSSWGTPEAGGPNQNAEIVEEVKLLKAKNAKLQAIVDEVYKEVVEPNSKSWIDHYTPKLADYLKDKEQGK